MQIPNTRVPVSLARALALLGAAVVATVAFGQSGGDVLPPGLIARGTGTGRRRRLCGP
jgi:hypothetical protein